MDDSQSSEGDPLENFVRSGVTNRQSGSSGPPVARMANIMRPVGLGSVPMRPGLPTASRGGIYKKN